MTLLTIIVLAATILIPLLPAMLIYLMLPSRTSVKGPFQGFQINLQGAFSGYFLLVLVAIGLVKVILPDPEKFPRYEEYTILGSIDLEGPEVPDLDSRRVQLYLYPRIESISQIGPNHFEWVGKVPVRRDYDNKISFPYERIVIEYPGFTTRQVELRSGSIQETSRKVTFEPVSIKARPDNRLPIVTLSNAQ